MKKAIRDVKNWLDSIDRNARAEKDPHRRAILENYRAHVALEFNGRWEEFLGPDMAVDEPVYKTRIGTDKTIVADGYNAVLGFYTALNEETILTNHDERLAVSDWGFASYNTFNMWTTGKHVLELGVEAADIDPEGYYRISRPLAMFWNYTADAKLIGEEVYEAAAATVEKIDPAEFPTWEEVREAVKEYLPAAKLRVKETVEA